MTFPSQAQQGSAVSLASFVPIDRRLAPHGELPLRANGAVLRADVAGFSLLTSELYETLGPKQGAERLSGFLNSAFDALISIVHRYGGSVIGFTGDGMTCWFGGDLAPIPATRAALECREAFPVPEGVSTPVGIHLAVTSGYTDRLVLGDPAVQRLDVLGGPTISRVELAEHLAGAGEVLVDWNAAGILEQHSAAWRRHHPDRFERRVDPVRDPLPFLVVPPIGLEAEPVEEPPPDQTSLDLSEWVTRYVRERVLSQEAELLTEYRLVATLFLKFGGIDYRADPRALERLDDYVRWAQEVIAAHKGELCQVIIGDKGSYFYAAFGAPLAHEDDPARAVRAALALRELPSQLAFMDEYQAGIAQGMMLCGLMGSPLRRTYGVVGAAANQAARLMERAEQGEILVAPEVAGATADSFLYRPVETDPQLLAVVERRVAAAEAEESGLPLVGRREALEVFSRWMEGRVPGESPRLVFVGAPGIGKTRLLTEIRRVITSMGLRSASGSSTSIDAMTPFFVWRQVFTRLLGLDGHEPPETVRDRLAEALPSAQDLTDLLPLLNPILPVNLPATEPTRALSAEASADAAAGLMLDLLVGLAGPETVLILDDAQWIDSASANLLQLMRNRSVDIPVVMATRPAPEPDEAFEGTPALPARVRRLLAPTDIVEVLTPLPDDQIEAVARAWLGVGELPTEVGELIAARADGNPLYGVELSRGFLLDGDLVIEDGRARLASPIDKLRRSVPAAIKVRLDSRVSDLPGDHQTTLKVASVLGSEFNPAMLAWAHPGRVTSEEIGRQLDALVRQGYLVRTAPPPDESFAFSHDLVREVARDLHVRETARPIHERAADWIVAHHPDLSDWYPILAHHWDEAGRTREAVEAYESAAEQDLATAAYDEAVAALSRAIELRRQASRPEDIAGRLEAARWHMLKGRARVLQQAEGEQDARHDLERGLRMIGLDRSRLVPVPLSILWEFLRHKAGVATARHPAERERLAEGARAYEQLVELNFLADDELGSAYAVIRSLNLATQAGDEALVAQGLVGLGEIFGLLPWRAQADRYIASAEAMADRSGDPGARIYVSLVRSFYYSGVGAWEEAERSSRLATQLAEAERHRRRFEDGLSHLMIQASFQGRLEECRRLSAELEESARRRGARRNVAYALQGRTYALLDEDLLEEAEAVLAGFAALGYDLAPDAPAEDGKARPDDEALASEVLGMRGTICARSGRSEEAVAIADRLLRRMKGKRPFNFSSILAYTAPFEIAVSAGPAGAGQVKQAQALAARYAKIFPIGRPRLLLWQGVREGREELVAESAAEAERLGMAVDARRARSRLAGAR